MTTSETTTSRATMGSPRVRRAIAVLLALALVASLVWLVLAFREHRAVDDNPAQENRDAVMLKAREYMLAGWNFGAGDLDENKSLTAYRSRVEPLITTSFKADFDKASELLEKAVASQGYSRRVTVDRVAVESLEEDSAVVIVGGESTESVKKQEQTGPYAWNITLKKVDDTWLVDDFSEYGAAQ
ncbi:hypothetical protein ncot_16730 [Nocardioides sp. JQ2195]|uniref:hypothetical protein n=1 Tax=Nocardioides sp. JQ2195 TaxID=2592334 RepID=UPI00143E81AC|nr:hypothetical protein [Nocardioides sp. JQ2195]QIX28053.1 hypothetical protein ncot_16730 [Nocardioides sp. JQ2195]